MYSVGHADSMRSLPSKVSALAFASIFLLSAAPSVTAESLESPTDFTATPSEDGVILSWGPPEDEEPDSYRVYLDGTLAATLADTSVWVPAATSYAVTAVYDSNGSESMAAVIVGPEANSGCTPITINNTPPFVHPRFQWQCMDPVWRLLEEFPPSFGSASSFLTSEVEFRL